MEPQLFLRVHSGVRGIHQHTSWEGRHGEARLGIEARVDRRRIGAAVSVSAGQRLGMLHSDRSGTRGGQDSGPTDDCGVGKRGTDCKEKKIFIVRLCHHRTLWFDETLAEVHFILTNAKLGVRYVCKGPGVKTISPRRGSRARTNTNQITRNSKPAARDPTNVRQGRITSPPA